jgi:high-affinity nickel permease
MIGESLTVSLLTVVLGVRHGMDSDHLAAIADMVGAERVKRRQLKMGIYYALGHGAIVMALGLIGILIGARLPASLASALEMFVGVSLLLLGSVILVSLWKQRSSYEHRSRWEIAYSAVMRVFGKKTQDGAKRVGRFGMAGAFAIGILHGIGAETPTQVMLLSASLQWGSLLAAVFQLSFFTLGMLIATILFTFLASWGFMKASVKKVAFIVLGAVTAAYSIFLGIHIITG